MSGGQFLALAALAVGMCVVFSYLRSVNTAMAVAALAGASAVMAIFLVDLTSSLVAQAEGYLTGLGLAGMQALVKAAYLSLVAEMACSLCRDSGFSSLAVKTEFAAKVAMLSLAAPLIKQLLEMLKEL